MAKWTVSAEEEYKLHPELKKDDVQTIQNWMKSVEYLPTIEDEMVCHFLFACFFNVDQTKKVIEHFYTYKNTMPDFLSDWDPMSDEIQITINNVLIAAPLPELDKDGNRVIVCKLNETSVENFNYAACVRWILMTSMNAIWSHGIQKGYVIVYDSTGYSMSHLFKCSLTNIRNYINYGKNASPIRVTKIVFINTSTVVKKLMTLVRPFLSKEIINMMSFHTDPESYFVNMPNEGIPEDYGGAGPALLSLHRQCVKRILDNKERIMAESKVRVDESKKGGKSKKDNTAKVESSLKALEID